jgi:hypothetical protein
MFKSTHFFFFAVLLAAGLLFTVNAQDITVNPNPVNEQQGQVPLNNTDAITITHSATQNIVSGNSVSCNAAGLHTDNSYFRAFDLNAFGITFDFNVTEVSIGIETCTGAGGTQPITVNLWTSSQPFPTGFPGSVTQIGTATINVPDQSLTVFPIAVTGLAPAGSELVVEIFTPDGQTAGNSFFIGSNPDGETGPSYLLAADCGITVPTTTGTIGFPTMHIVMNVTGDEIIPVELTSFTASANANQVVLNWATATETNNSGFEVQRAVDGEYLTIAFVSGYGTTTEAQQYSYTDKNVQVGTYSYRLKQVDLDGTFEYSNVVEVEVLPPAEFSLAQNFPNPFNPSTKINYSLAVDSKVTLTVYNLLGEAVSTLVNNNVTAGTHSVNFDAVDFNSGVYFYSINAQGINGESFTQVRKMMLTK